MLLLPVMQGFLGHDHPTSVERPNRCMLPVGRTFMPLIASSKAGMKSSLPSTNLMKSLFSPVKLLPLGCNEA